MLQRIFCVLLLVGAFQLDGLSQVIPNDSIPPQKSDRKRTEVPKDSSATESPIKVIEEPSPSNLPGKMEDGSLESIVEKNKAKEEPWNDTTLSRRERRRAGLLPPDPNVAVRRSLVLPGWGQVYNRSVYKVPFIYAGFGVLGFFVVDNHRQYKYHQRAAICVQDTNCTDYPEFNGFDVSNVISIRDFHRRFRDFNVILGVLWYGIQAIDSYIEAHLKPFNVNEDLSMHIRPTLNMDPFRRNQQVFMGATISLKLRK